MILTVFVGWRRDVSVVIGLNPIVTVIVVVTIKIETLVCRGSVEVSAKVAVISCIVVGESVMVTVVVPT